MTCSWDGSLRVWNLKSGKQIGDDWRDGETRVWTIALSPDEKKVVSGSDDGGVRLWDIDTGKVIGRWMGHTNGVDSVCWSRDSQRVLSGSHDGTARQWDVENGETILTPIKAGHYLLAVVYSPDMTLFATGGFEHPWDNTGDNKSAIKIWNAKTGELVATLQPGHVSDWVRCLIWTPDGKTLISGSNNWSIRTWNTSTWKQIALLEGHTYAVKSIAISPNGRILVSTSYDRTARLWNLDDNQPISSPLQHLSTVLSVSFSADGTLLATAGADKNAYTWDISAIVKQAGLDELLVDQRDKSVLTADATRRPVRPFDLSAGRPIRQPIIVPQRRMPQGFFDDLPDQRSCFSTTSPAPSISDTHDRSSRPRPFHWVRNRLSGKQGGEDIERPSAAVDVPYAKGKRRNASARERRMKIIPLKPGHPATSTSLPPNSNAAQHSSDAGQAQSSQAQAAVSTSTAPPIANTTSHPNLDATIKNTGRWTRFWLFFCCTSPEYTHSHQ
ncbi:WD40-repeat-containing domain protein [Suillus discolor]|uniref:WD40-repeat-containing domain protein n=1 Tax=Suillus discolor TaxID=1912936 RepID=A0A9P7F2K5_9AGAM|nr:WD40-repeat-containing domain protein [Suillus discolor]KAG2102279.1 WD40-repeat-containing domain protein [Suillus discolor]